MLQYFPVVSIKRKIYIIDICDIFVLFWSENTPIIMMY